MLKRELQSILNASGRNPLADLAYLRPDQVPLRYPFSRALTYQLLNSGAIRSVSIPGPGGVRGIRLISVASIEAYLSRLAKEQQDAGFTRAVAKEFNTGRRGRRSGGTEASTTSQGQEAELKRRGRGRPRKEEQALEGAPLL
jgi:hypothetical protein